MTLHLHRGATSIVVVIEAASSVRELDGDKQRSHRKNKAKQKLLRAILSSSLLSPNTLNYSLRSVASFFFLGAVASRVLLLVNFFSVGDSDDVLWFWSW
ncbi:hypothetical protein ACSQ67_006641 [Phaseolus vulgaris]